MLANRLGTQFLEAEIEIEPAELAPDAFGVILSKINELPIVMAAVACD